MAIDARDRQRVCEFRVGRAGSGKTHSCLEEIAAELIRAPRGPLLLLIAPEQATAQLERRLATWPGVPGGFTRARVAALSRLAGLALEDSGDPLPDELSETGRTMLIGRGLRRLNAGRTLRIFGPAADLPALAEKIHEALLEMERYGWRPETIERWLADQPASALQQATARKMQDLLEIWKGLESDLRQGGWQGSDQRHASARQALLQWPALEGCRIWIDGFSSFTAKEFELLDSLLARAESAAIALLADPEQIVRLSTRPRTGPERLFDNTEATYRDLETRVASFGWTTRLRPLPLPGQPTRFSRAPALAHLERNVLGRLRPQVFQEDPGEAIALIEAESRRAEVEGIARRIVALCRTDDPAVKPRLLWRDIGVLARDLAPYDRLVREVFGAFDIPFFIDRPRSGSGHPLTRLLLSAIELLREDWSGSAAIHHLKSGLAGLRDLDLISRLENLILASDPDRKGWVEELKQHPALAAGWLQAAAPLEALARTLRSGANPAAALRDFLNALGVAAVLTDWMQEARDAGDEEMADLHERIWALAGKWLEDAEAVWAGAPEPLLLPADWRAFLDDLAAMIESALSSARAKLIPPTLNQVTVGQVDRSRTPDIDTLFVLGLNEGEFPRQWNSDPIIGDAEREAIGGEGRKLGPDAAAMRIQETYFGYVALTRASRRLVLMRPLIGDDGKGADPSPFFTLVAEAFPQASRRVVGPVADGDDPRLGLRPEEWERRLSAAARLADLPEGGMRLAELMAAGDPLDQAAIPASRRTMVLAGRRAAWIDRPPLTVSAEAVAEALGERATLSVTALEGWFHCPFSFYAKRLLNLREREEARLTPAELGMARHALLEALFRQLRSKEGLDWGKVEPAAAERIIDAAIAQIRRDPEHGGKWRRGALHGLELARLGSEMKLIVRALGRAAAAGRFRQWDAEREFGRGAEADVALAGGRIALSGKIDRIDLYEPPEGDPVLLLFDYKSGRRSFRRERAEGGIELQLAVYALAVPCAAVAGKPPRIGGFFYWPMALPAIPAAPAGEDDALVGAGWFARSRPAGAFAADIAGWLDAEVVPDSKSAIYGFRRNKDGALGKVGMQVEPAEFAAMLDAMRRVAEFGAQGILAGFIDAQPYALKNESPCSLCAFAAVCRRVESVCERTIEAGAPLAFRGFAPEPGG